MTERLDATEAQHGIAIVGMAGRFPGARTLDEFWQNLRSGVESIRFFEDEELRASGVPDDLLRNPAYVKARGVLDDVDLFDSAFFGFNPREADVTDPQHRVFLECAWEAIEHAGYDPSKTPGPVGVFAGASQNSYLGNLAFHSELQAAVGPFQLMVGNYPDYMTSRVAYKLNLQGPGITVQTACSTSLVAVALACESLLHYQCDVALAGGSSISVPQAAGYLYEPASINSPDGHCRPFDAAAQGTVWGSGVGVVALKRLADAVADGDFIHAVIKGSAVNNDGSAKVGFTAPGVEGQAEVIATAQAVGDVSPDTISYIEAHGTATPLGDPIEVAALTAAFRTGSNRTQFCALGSVKGNVGHLDTAAGVAGLIKTVLALQHGEIPPSLHYRQPNPEIDFAASPFFVNACLAPWPSEGPRRAGVSSFGIGGTNAHVVLEEAPTVAPSDPAIGEQLLVLSARTPEALEAATAQLGNWLRVNPGANLADVAYTLQAGRAAFAYRRMLVAKDTADAAAALAARDATRLRDALVESQERPITFLFPGQGAQYVGMAQDLYVQEPVFRQALDRCAAILQPYLERDLRAVLYPAADQAAQAAAELQATALAQPAIFSVEYALSRLWQSWGVQPAAVMGHSLGEYVAACLAGMITLEEALALVAERGRLMQQAPPGAMLAAPLAVETLQPLLGDDLALAAINGPSLCVVSGTEERIAVLQQQLANQGVETSRLHTSHAFHSALMEPIVPSFAAAVARVKWQPPTLPLMANLTGAWADETMAAPRYWTEHLRRPVQFAAGLDALLADPQRILLEVGPGTTLGRLARGHPRFAPSQVVLTSARHPQNRETDRAVLLGALGRLWLAGVAIDWAAVHAHQRRRRLPLPTYPFQRQRHWIDPLPAPTALPHLAVPRRQDDPARWTSVPSWRRKDLPRPLDAEQLAEQRASWLVFGASCGFAAHLVDRLEQAGHSVTTVLTGPRFSQQSDRCYTVDPRSQADYDALFSALAARGQAPTSIVHLWSVSTIDKPWTDLDQLAETQERGFYSLLFLAQALGNRSAADPMMLNVITNQVHAVSGDERLCPTAATVAGPCQIIPREYPAISCREIDLVLPAAGAVTEDKALDQLLTELLLAPASGLVAHRGGHRWTPALEAVRLDHLNGTTAPLRAEGVYLITGGLGGIGFTLAEHLARSVHARLVLVGRSALPGRERWEDWLASHDELDETGRRIRRVQALEALGVEVWVTSADVTKLDQMVEAVRQTQERFGALHGVIHAAGLPGAGVIQLKTPAMAAEVLAPKVLGTLVLDAALRAVPLDFFMLCSSISAIVAPMGQVDYCSANAFLDAYANAAAAQQGRHVVAINWDAWREVGMAAAMELPADLQAERARQVAEGISPAEGSLLFHRVLRSVLPQVIVSTRDLQALAEYAAAETATPTGPDRRAPMRAPVRHDRPVLPTAYVAPRTPVEQIIADLWQDLLGVDKVGIHDDFFELGGHSLLAIQFLSRLRATLQVDLSMRAIFDSSTVALLAATIEDGAVPAATDDGIVNALTQIEQLSDEEVQRLLAQVDRPS